MYKYIKPILDFIIALISLIVLAIPLLLVALWIKLDSPGPVLFVQERVGQNLKPFNIYKFRSMRSDTPKNVPTHMLRDAGAYITKSGHFMRKTSVDELPQLLNIIKGEMSIIGPRPALFKQQDLLDEREKYNANSVKPGLSGWAQVNGRDELPIPIKARLDGEYIKNYGFIMDVKCFIMTFTTVLSKKGYQEGEKK